MARATTNIVNIDVLPSASKNLVIDGQFNHWDQGLSFTSGGQYYTATMWETVLAEIGSPSITRENFTVGQQETGNNPTYFTDFAGTTNNPATSNCQLAHKIKGLRATADKLITITFDAKGSVAGDAGILLTQRMGTGGSPSGNVFFGGQLIPLTTSWQNYSITIQTPSLSGKTLGTSQNDHLSFAFIKILGNTITGFFPDDINPNYQGTLSIANVTIVEGATDFRGPFPTPEEERIRIDPYYESSYNKGAFEGSANTSGLVNYLSVGNDPMTHAQFVHYRAFKVTAAGPSITLYNEFGVPNEIYSPDNALSYPAQIISQGENGFTARITPNTAITERFLLRFHYAADARL